MKHLVKGDRVVIINRPSNLWFVSTDDEHRFDVFGDKLPVVCEVLSTDEDFTALMVNIAVAEDKIKGKAGMVRFSFGHCDYYVLSFIDLLTE